MRYLGGKTRLAKKIAAEILSRTTNRNTYLEPFVGGGSVFCELAPHFQRAVASDIHPDLAMMWDAISKGWVPPKTMTKDEYDALNHGLFHWRFRPRQVLGRVQQMGQQWGTRFRQ